MNALLWVLQLLLALHTAVGAIYWLAVAAVCAFIIYGRLVLRPIGEEAFA